MSCNQNCNQGRNCECKFLPESCTCNNKTYEPDTVLNYTVIFVIAILTAIFIIL